MVLSDGDILARLMLPSTDPYHLRIDPFVERCPPDAGISYGLTSAGYDVRPSGVYLVCNDVHGITMDPMAPNPDAFTRVGSKEDPAPYCDVPPHGFVLAETVERFRVPRDIIATCIGKSTYVRNGIIACVTPLEPEWEGTITVEIHNTSPNRARVHTGRGILQVMFNVTLSVCRVSYKDKKGKYQYQSGITLGKAQ